MIKFMLKRFTNSTLTHCKRSDKVQMSFTIDYISWNINYDLNINMLKTATLKVKGQFKMTKHQVFMDCASFTLPYF